MTPADFRAARQATGLTQARFARALGREFASERDPTAAARDAASKISNMESGREPISRTMAKLAEMYRRFGIPDDLRN